MRLLMVFCVLTLGILSDAIGHTGTEIEDKFRQLDELLPTPDSARLASGAPGPEYWQQKVDYRIEVELDDNRQIIRGKSAVRYHNNSPHHLTYLWLQLDQNRFIPDSAANQTRLAPKRESISFFRLGAEIASQSFDGGFNLHYARNQNGEELPFQVVGTLMRIDLTNPVGPGERFDFTLAWDFKLVNRKEIGGRSGYEYFEKDGNYMYEVSQWYPRLAVYSAQEGWHIKPFLGKGEFALEFGDFDVSIRVPADHIVAATGELQNSNDVLTGVQQARLEKARTTRQPVLIVTPQEALANEKRQAKRTKIWRFIAENVRDFAFASSRKFVWGAQGYRQPGTDRTVMAMSFYPEESNPLWGKYATAVVIHTLEVYSRFTFPYPYPVAQIVNSAAGGMEYPMIGFTAVPRSREKESAKRTYGRSDKYELLAVVIHEVGHNYFPMIVNSDERRWAWLDEGLTSFLELMAENAWEEDFAGSALWVNSVNRYMTSERQYPVMTQPDALISSYSNAYVKVTTALNILRETVMGRALFDRALREYANRWQFKRATPADFFRTMEDVSGIDLDWFWRGWFYTTDHVDISLDSVTKYRIDSLNPDREQKWLKEQYQAKSQTITRLRDAAEKKRVERHPHLSDFYNQHDEFWVTEKQRKEYREMLKTMDERDQALLSTDTNIYRLEFSNPGGLVMPLILQFRFKGGATEERRIPAEIWRKNSVRVSKLFLFEQELEAVILDPLFETSDVNTVNNHYPRRIEEKRLQLKGKEKSRDMMKEVLQP